MYISEIFYSLQGEGERTGTSNVFIRTQGCKAQNACFKAGIRCDTEFESGEYMTAQELLGKCRELSGLDSPNVVFTGGEPLQQEDFDVVSRHLADNGLYIAVETSGLFPVLANSHVDYLACSPKVAEHVVNKNFPEGVDELRYVRHKGQSIPQPKVQARFYYISPHFDGMNPNDDNIRHCMELVKKNPEWRLSVQDHKLWNIL